MKKFKVTFYPDNKTIEVEKDKTILSAAISAGIHLKSACAGDGVCGQCKVILRKGTVITQSSGTLSLEERKNGIYLACMSEISSDLEIEVPETSKMDFEKLSPEELNLRLKGVYSEPEDVDSPTQILRKELFTHTPLTKKIYLELPVPTLEDKISDLERLHRGLNTSAEMFFIHTPLTNIKYLGGLLRDADWKVTATINSREGINEILFIEPGNTSEKNFGFCLDIGTTTITGQLVDLNTKQVLGTKAAYNKQANFGSDIISRIIYAQEKDGLEKLHYAVIDELNKMIEELAAEHNIDLNDLTCVMAAGNTTMIHFLLQVDPTYIRREPYIPTANFVPIIRAVEAGIKINPRGILSCVPGVSSYVGGDVTSGVLSCGMDRETELSLLIDIGTNGEMVLGNKEFLVSCAASAGPAFEGSGVSCGMRAAKGAIQKIKINPKDYSVNFETIGNNPPRGICGSGYIDLISELLSAGIIDKSGKIKIQDNNRIRKTESGKEFIIASSEEFNIPADVIITEADIENIKRAKAAIYSAAAILVKHMGFNLTDVKKVFIAGGFGSYLDIEKSIKIGLLPDLDRSRYLYIGNSSLAGARQMILSSDATYKAHNIARKITYFELSADAAYMEEYIAALFFPHTDLAKFPSLKIN